MTDVDGYRVIRGQSIFIPDALVDLCGGKNTSGIFHEKKQDIIFDGRHPYRFSIYQHLFFVIVYRKTSGCVDVFRCCRCSGAKLCVPAQLGFYPGDQLQRIERFGDIVICTDVKAKDFVRVFRFCGQDDDGQRIAFPDLDCCPDPVETGHHHIDDQQIYSFAVQDIQCFLSVIGFQNVIAFLRKIDFDSFHDVFVVIANKYVSHFFVPP